MEAWIFVLLDAVGSDDGDNDMSWYRVVHTDREKHEGRNLSHPIGRLPFVFFTVEGGPLSIKLLRPAEVECSMPER
ncbi:MAG: hypothetical protein P8X55_13470 [Desulfosarcinaceae bacterium]